MLYITESLSEHSTPRKCFHCMKPATLVRFSRDSGGQINKSSKQPTCEEHAQRQKEEF